MGTMAGSVEDIGAAAAAPQALELHAVQHLGELRSAFESGRTRPLAWRQDQLRGLLRLLANKEEEAFRAIHDDLGKHRAEVGVIIKSANTALREIGKWVAPEKVWVPRVAFPASARVVPEPLGVVLIFCWNFPLEKLTTLLYSLSIYRFLPTVLVQYHFRKLHFNRDGSSEWVDFSLPELHM